MEERDIFGMLSGRKDWDSTSSPRSLAACSCFCLSYQSPNDDMVDVTRYSSSSLSL